MSDTGCNPTDGLDGFFQAVSQLRPEHPAVPTASIIASTTNPCTAGALTIYSHGYSIRLRLLLPRQDAEARLAACGWSSPQAGSKWISTDLGRGDVRDVLRGCVWLTGRAPRNSTLPLAQSNKAWKTRLYGLAVERRSDTYYLDLAGVRIDDIERLLVTVMGIVPWEYEVVHYRQMERYVVLAPHEAQRLATALGGVPHAGKGRKARVRYLVENHPFPVQVRSRATATATVTVYRIVPGATCAYRCEVRLAGKTRDREVFHEADRERLDEVLRGLVRDHDLHPLAKPSRWEPRSFVTTVERGGFDPLHQKLRLQATRGARPETVVPLKCNTLGTVKLVLSPRQSTPFPTQPRVTTTGLSFTSSTTTKSQATSSMGSKSLPQVREGAPETSETLLAGPSLETSASGNLHAANLGSNQTSGPNFTAKKSNLPPRRSAMMFPGGAWAALTDELRRLPPGTLSEIVLADTLDPTPLVVALAQHFGQGMAVGHLGNVYDMSRPLAEWIGEHVLPDDPDLFVLVIDPDVIEAIVPEIPTRPLPPGSIVPVEPLMKTWVPSGIKAYKALSDWLSPLMEGLHDIGESTGMSIVVVTTDARPARAYRLLPTKYDYGTDQRVRSTIGDAGRYHAHQRYRVEKGSSGRLVQVMALKDETEGLPGRLVYTIPPWLW